MAKNVFRAQEVVNLGSKLIIESPSKPACTGEARAEGERHRSRSTWARAPTICAARPKRSSSNGRKKRRRWSPGRDDEAEAIVKQAKGRRLRRGKEAEPTRPKRGAKRPKTKRAVSSMRRRNEAAELFKSADDQLRRDGKRRPKRKAWRRGRKRDIRQERRRSSASSIGCTSIINTAIEKRAEILAESETQLIALVLLIAKKVVKVISENQKNVVINNVIQALRKLKTRGDVIIHVNLADVELTSEHVKDFMRMVENVRSITVLEDSTVDKGGCIIETDFGQIDARIASQLHEIEERILDLAPIKVKGEQQ